MVKFRDPFDKPPPREDREDRERLSWREIDQRRDGTARVDRDKPKGRRQATEERSNALALKALQDAFRPRKTKEQAEAWKKVTAAQGKMFSRRARTYVEKHGIPREWDDLLRLLDHEESDFVKMILEKMMELAPNESSGRKDLLVGKLRILKMTCEDERLLPKMEDCLKTLSEDV